MAQQWKDLLFCLAAYWYFSLCPERLRQFTARDLGRGRKSQTCVPPFSPPVISVRGGPTHPPTEQGASSWKLTPIARAAILPQVSCASHWGLSSSRDLILNITPGRGSRSPPQALPMLADALGDGWHVLLLPGHKSPRRSPLMLSRWDEQEARGCGKTKQGSEPRFLTPPSSFAPFSLKPLGTSSGQELPYHKLFLPVLDTISSFHCPAPAVSSG